MSFLKLSGELRNNIYDHYLALNPSPIEVADIVSIHEQIYAEFGSLYLGQDRVEIFLMEMECFLSILSVESPYAALKLMPCNLLVRLAPDISTQQTIDLLQLVSVMRHYPLLDVRWSVETSQFRFNSPHGNEITSLVDTLKPMGTRQADRLVSAVLKVPYSIDFFTEFSLNLIPKEDVTKDWHQTKSPRLTKRELGFVFNYSRICVRTESQLLNR